MGTQVLERFGKYFLLDCIGTGGMAGIFRARPAHVDANGRITVIKRMLPHVARDPQFLAMFKSETSVSMGFNHPNLVQIHDFGEVGGQAYLAMEYVEGKNLKELMVAYARENEHVPLEMALGICERAARGLAYAHVFTNSATGEKLNLVHRDISPHNLLISYDGHVKVIDFGIAKAEVENYEHTREGIIKGKVGYLSPEQVNGEKLDGRSDIFALGIVLWELLTGRRLFGVTGQSDLDILQSIQHCDQIVVSPSSVNSKIPPELDSIVLKALTQDPAMRYPNAEEFSAAIKRFLSANHPSYGPDEIGSELRRLFSAQILEDHESLRELNFKAQHVLSIIPKKGPGSSVAPPPLVVPPPLAVASPAMAPVPLTPVSRGQRFSASDHLSALLTSASGPARRGLMKVTRGRAIAAALYVLTIIAIKLDEKYLFVERLMLPSDVIAEVSKAERPHPVGSHFNKLRAPASGARTIAGKSARDF